MKVKLLTILENYYNLMNNHQIKYKKKAQFHKAKLKVSKVITIKLKILILLLPI